MTGDEDQATPFIATVEDGALTSVPIFDNHRRARNWGTIIGADPSAPSGLARVFLARAHGHYYYLAGLLKPGQAVEFGADGYSGSGYKRAKRFYGVILEVTDQAIHLEECTTARAALARAKELRR